jgi:hypothetical protein
LGSSGAESDIFFTFHEDELVGAVGFYLGEDSHSDVALADEEVVAIGFEDGVDAEDSAIGEEVVEPGASLTS